MSVDVAACEREELSRIGLVQPHGGVAVLDAERQHVIAASAGLHRLLDLRTALRPGSPASALPAGLLDELAEFTRSGAATAALGHDETDLERQVHRTEDGSLVEWIQPTEAPLQGVLAAAAEATAEHLAQQLAATAPNAFGAAQLLAQAAARISGYDRVMVYRFHPDWSGEVVAERRRPDLQPYLGLRYPASDIPPQARALYQRHLLRIVVDVQDVAIPLLHASPVPPDLAPALLRSVSASSSRAT